MKNLSGQWTGSYSYPGSLVPVPFIADIRDQAGHVVGEIDEDGIGFHKAGRVFATIEGHHNGSTLIFLKIYDHTGPEVAPVHYRGDIDADATEIGGTWEIKGNWSGPFVMTRPKQAKQAAKVEESVEL